jgi:hypothetical protein
MVVTQEAKQRRACLRDVRRGHSAGPRKEVLRYPVRASGCEVHQAHVDGVGQGIIWQNGDELSKLPSPEHFEPELGCEPYPAAAAARPSLPETTGSIAHTALHARSTAVAVVGSCARTRLGGPSSMAAGGACTRAMRFPRRAAASGIRGTGGPTHDVATLCTRNIGEVGARRTEATRDRNSVGPPMETDATSGGAAARNGAGGRKRPAETPCGAHRKLVSMQSPRTSATVPPWARTPGAGRARTPSGTGARTPTVDRARTPSPARTSGADPQRR